MYMLNQISAINNKKRLAKSGYDISFVKAKRASVKHLDHNVPRAFFKIQ